MKNQEKLKEQRPKLCFFERSKVDLLKSTVRECTQWFNSTVIVCERVCVCVRLWPAHAHKSMSCFI